MSFLKDIKPKKGDLIRVQRKIGYFHFGIYIGHNKVIHFSADKDDSIFDNTNIKIQKCKLEDFLRGDTLEVNYPYSGFYKRWVVCRRAKKKLGDKYFNDRAYDLLENNCEHFANYCYYGVSVSDQSDAVNKGPVGIFSRLGVSLFNSLVKSHVSKQDGNKVSLHEDAILDFSEGANKRKNKSKKTNK